MPDPLGNFHDCTDGELIAKMQGVSVSSSDYSKLRAELDRRVAIAQLNAASAQVKSAWFQLGAVIAALLAALATVAAAYISK